VRSRNNAVKTTNVPGRWSVYASVLAIALLTCIPAWAADSPCPPVPVPRLSLPATSAALAAGRPIGIVALGSSSTAGVGASAPNKSYPSLLQAALRAAWPGHEIKVFNQGLGGEEVDGMVARLDRDVIATHPVLVIWQSGTNAALRHMDPDVFDATLDAGLTKLTSTGADVVLMDNQLSPKIDAAPDHEAYGAAIARDAAKHHDSLFSRAELMREWQAGGANDLIGPDGVHHSDRGYACVASVLAQAIIEAVKTPVKLATGTKP